MLKITEFQGKTVQDALVNASISLGMPKNEIKYEVVTYGSTGIFGLIGAKKAIIKVSIYEGKKERHNRPDLSLQKKVNLKAEDEESFSKDGLKMGLTVLQKIVDSISDSAKIEVSEKNHQQVVFEIKVDGNKSGILIGKKGQTLEAMQYIVEKIVNKNTSNKRLRIMIDVEGYLEKKRENLQKLANKMLAKARRTKKPVTIGQMNAYDRRIVHTHLKNECNIKTQSIGSGYYRKLMIFPTKSR